MSEREELLAELRRHQREYAELVHGPLCGQAADEIERLLGGAQEVMREALKAAREWIIENTTGENDLGDGVMYERGWWNRDTELMAKIDAALSQPSINKGEGK